MGKFESGARSGTWSIDYSSFDAKALLTHAKMKLTMTISKFSSFIYYVFGLFVWKTKIEGITTILLITDFDHVKNKILVFWHKNLKILALIGTNIQRHSI